jgi:hypothetical protein
VVGYPLIDHLDDSKLFDDSSDDAKMVYALYVGLHVYSSP